MHFKNLAFSAVTALAAAAICHVADAQVTSVETDVHIYTRPTTFSNTVYMGVSKLGIGQGMTNPVQAVHVYGTNTVPTSDDDMNESSIFIDGVTGADKSLIFGDNNAKHWAWYTYRNESGKYLYLYNYDSVQDVMVINSGGRTGINVPSDIMDFHSVFTGTKLNDLEFAGTNSTEETMVIKIIVAATNATNDLWVMAYSTDLGATFVTNSVTNLMSLVQVLATNGAYVSWGSLTGHGVGDSWKSTIFSQIPRASLTVGPAYLSEVLVLTNLAAGPGSLSDWVDRTAEANSSDADTFYPIRTGTNSGLYVGGKSKFAALYFNMAAGSAGAKLVFEVWSGASWTRLNATNNLLVDGTSNFTQSGEVTYDRGTFAWTKTNMTVWGFTDELYWMRIYSITNVTSAPSCQSMSRNGKDRFAVYNSHYDLQPAFKVDANGDTWIRGYKMSSSIISSFYNKFIANQPAGQPLTNAVVTKILYTNVMSDVGGVYSGSTADWAPGTTNMCRIVLNARLSILGQNKTVNVYLYQNATNWVQIWNYAAAVNGESPMVNPVYCFMPQNATNKYSIWIMQNNGGTPVNLTTNIMENRWFGEQIQ